jgi:hypothetical protein
MTTDKQPQPARMPTHDTPSAQPQPWPAGPASPHDAQVMDLLAYGWRVESAGSWGTTLRKPPHHLVHFLLGLFTFGLWWLVWLVLALTPRRRTIPRQQPPASEAR